MPWPWNLDLPEALVVVLRVPPLFMVDIVLKGTLSQILPTVAHGVLNRSPLGIIAQVLLQMSCELLF